MSAESAKSKPDTDEQYCTSCGEIVKEKAKFCPECGVTNQQSSSQSVEDGKNSRLGITGYSIISIITGLIALLFFPPVFGAISIFCGYQVYKKHHELIGLGLIALGGVTTVIGIIIGMAAFA